MGALSESTDASTTVGATSTTILDANGSRRQAIFVNNSNETIFLRRGTPAVINTGIPLRPNGGAYEITTANLYTGIITAICASGGKTLCVEYMTLDSYASITEVRRYTGVGDEYSDAAITDLLTMATLLINEVTGRTWLGIQTVTDEYYDGDDTDTLWLNNTEVQSITSLAIDDDDDGTYTSVTVASYVKHKSGDSYIVLDRSAEVTNFTAGTKTIKISYTWGNDSPTERVKRLCILIVQNMINFDAARESQINDELDKLKQKGPIGLI